MLHPVDFATGLKYVHLFHLDWPYGLAFEWDLTGSVFLCFFVIFSFDSYIRCIKPATRQLLGTRKLIARSRPELPFCIEQELNVAGVIFSLWTKRLKQ